MKDIAVLFNDTTGKLSLGFNGFAENVTGMDWLVQSIVKKLLTERGSNFYDQTVGTYFTRLIGASFNDADMETIKLNIANAVSSVEAAIKNEQAFRTDLSPEERLDSLEVTNVIYNKVDSLLEVYIRVTLANNITVTVRV